MQTVAKSEESEALKKALRAERLRFAHLWGLPQLFNAEV